MRIYREKDYDAMSRRAATIIAAQIVAKPDCVLGLATGSSPVGTYKNLVAWNKQGDISFKEVRSVNLDEYYGLSGDHDQSYRYFMQTNLFDHVDIVPENTNVPNGLAQDPAAEGERYEALVASLGYADLQLLGMGRNGHIGFNEPCGELPKQALSMGIGTIMKARKILVVVSGEDKADAVAKAVQGPIAPEVPASILQLHPDVTIVGDEAALSGLK